MGLSEWYDNSGKGRCWYNELIISEHEIVASVDLKIGWLDRRMTWHLGEGRLYEKLKRPEQWTEDAYENLARAFREIRSAKKKRGLSLQIDDVELARHRI